MTSPGAPSPTASPALSMAARADLYRQLASLLSPGSTARFDEPLSRHTTWGVGGPADLYVEPGSESDLLAALRFARLHQIRLRVIGSGSNLLVLDHGFRGIIVCLRHPCFRSIEPARDQLRCGAGAPLAAIVREAARARLGGLEFLEGIPGTVGGALRMNAGAMNRSFFDVLRRVRFMSLDGAVSEIAAAELQAGYRSCPFFETHIALSATLQAAPSPPETIRRLIALYRRRRQAQPAGRSAGCTFKNPGAISAGQLIDELGLKGARVGHAVVSTVHANFILNDGGATARDILALLDRIRSEVRSRRGIQLEPEVQIIGGEPAPAPMP